jgi:hypothetical protein
LESSSMNVHFCTAFIIKQYFVYLFCETGEQLAELLVPGS